MPQTSKHTAWGRMELREAWQTHRLRRKDALFCRHDPGLLGRTRKSGSPEDGAQSSLLFQGRVNVSCWLHATK